MSRCVLLAAVLTLLATTLSVDAQESPAFPLFEALTADPAPKLIAYTPLGLDPRQPTNNETHPTSAFRADLEALRPAFDGLVLYGYNQASTPRILALAKELKYRVVLLGIWQPKSADELDGVAKLVEQFKDDMALGVIVGNEGVTFGRYEPEDVAIAAARLRSRLPNTIPLTTSEPLVGYQRQFFLEFGDFLAPNIHPVFDRKDLGPADAAEWARSQALALAEKTGKPVLLKETGFPHGGESKYMPESQAAFWSAYIDGDLLVKPDNSDAAWTYFGVAFEAYDLPWKAEASGLPIEKSWGLLSTERKPFPAFEVWRGAGQR